MLFSFQIVVYLFLGGTGGGMLLVSSVWSIYAHQRRAGANARKMQEFEGFFLRCTIVGVVVLVVALMCLFWDLGRPERALNLFFTSHPNVLTVGAYSLSIDLLLALALIALAVFRLPAPERTVLILRMLCGAFSLIVIVYTGAYLYSLEAVAFWHSPSIVAVFLFSSLSSGLSATLLIAYFNPKQTMVLVTVAPLQRAHIAIVAAEAASIAAFLYLTSQNPAAATSLSRLVSPEVLPTASIGVGLMALAVPLVSESASLASRDHRHIPASDVLCIMGCLMLRYIVVLCGAH